MSEPVGMASASPGVSILNKPLVDKTKWTELGSAWEIVGNSHSEP